MSTSESKVSSYKLVIFAIVGALVVAIGLGVFFTNQGVINEGNRQQATLSASYSNGAVYLSKCVVNTKQAAGLLKSQTAAVDKVLSDAVAGRYGTGNEMDKAKLFSAITEAYPEASIEGLNKSYSDVLVVITGCQNDFANKQSVILDNVRQFDSWLTGSTKVRFFGGSGFPNENLKVTLPGINLTGAEALAKIRQPIVDAITSKAYETGEQSLDDPFAEK